MNYYALTYSPSILLGLATFVICGLTALALARLSNTKPDDSENRQQTLDGLRGLLATGVFLHHYVLTFYLLMAGCGIIIVKISWVTYNFIEKPFINLGKMLGSFTIAEQQPSKEETYERV